ncbi:MAG: helix-turn-helix domain-containing protein [Syntrophomonadaceae bacterium]|nr:helix-turn-helix domain-containing protein [Syntrophomonadaceae bacterium]
MISLLEKQQIILRHYHNGESQRKIHRDTGISRKTISKYMRKYEQAKKELIDNNGCHSDLVEDIMDKPIYMLVNSLARSQAAFRQINSESKKRVAAKNGLTTRLFFLEPMRGFEPRTC